MVILASLIVVILASLIVVILASLIVVILASLIVVILAHAYRFNTAMETAARSLNTDMISSAISSGGA